MIDKQSYENGLRCRGICNFCGKIQNCYQYLKDIKGTKYDVNKGEDKMKINDLRTNQELIEVGDLEQGIWFIYYNELYRISDYETCNTTPCIYQKTGRQIGFNNDVKVTPVEVEINILSTRKED